jgi:hypothetical protein
MVLDTAGKKADSTAPAAPARRQATGGRPPAIVVQGLADDAEHTSPTAYPAQLRLLSRWS